MPLELLGNRLCQHLLLKRNGLHQLLCFPGASALTTQAQSWGLGMRKPILEDAVDLTKARGTDS